MFKAAIFKSLSTFVSRRTLSSEVAMSLKNKTAVVTASTDGIGLAIAERLAQQGANVVISSRKESNVNKALEGLSSKGFKNIIGNVCHVGNKSDRENLLKLAATKFGGIDILVSNAAVNPTVGPVLDCPEDIWDKIFEINVKSAFMIAKEVVPYLKKRGGGSIVFVSSIAGFQPIDLLGAYSVSKTALLGLTKVAAIDLAADNIRVNCVAPGIIKTKFSSALTESDVAKDAILNMVPLRRFGKPEEVANVVTFLCSNEASYVTGENFVVSGGMPSRL